MADTTRNPNQERERNWQGPNPPPANPSKPSKERPMDDPGRGDGDELEHQLPGSRQSQEPSSTD